jgi:hypothetical protein
MRATRSSRRGNRRAARTSAARRSVRKLAVKRAAKRSVKSLLKRSAKRASKRVTVRRPGKVVIKAVVKAVAKPVKVVAAPPVSVLYKLCKPGWSVIVEQIQNSPGTRFVCPFCPRSHRVPGPVRGFKKMRRAQWSRLRRVEE